MQADKHSGNGEDQSEQQPWYYIRSCALRTKDQEQNRTANNSGNEYDCYRHELFRKLGGIRGGAQVERSNQRYHGPNAEGDEASRKYTGNPVKNIKRHKRQSRYAPSKEKRPYQRHRQQRGRQNAIPNCWGAGVFHAVEPKPPCAVS